MALRVHLEIAGALETQRGHHQCHQQQRIDGFGIPAFLHAVERVAHALDPDGIGIKHEERLALEIGQRFHDAAAGAQQLVILFRDADFNILALREMCLEHVGFVVRVDDSHRHAGRDEAVERVVDQCLARNLHQRLGAVIGQRPHPRAQTRRHHHRPRGSAQVTAPSTFPRASRGMVLSYHDFSFARAGCSRSRFRYPQTRGK